MSPWDAPCRHYIGETRCGATPTRLFARGRRCRDHDPRRADQGHRAQATKDQKETAK